MRGGSAAKDVVLNQKWEECDMSKLKLFAGAAVLGILLGGSASAAPLNIAFTVHSSAVEHRSGRR